MQAIFQSFGLVLACEMGDKTQLLALILAARFRRPWTIMAGILAATLLNHGLASVAGGWLAALVAPQYLRVGLTLTFLFFAVWVLIPDREEDLKTQGKWGAFVTTVVAFFLAEMGDKTQLATVALGATFAAPVKVTLGTTLGMLVADGLAVFFGSALTNRVEMKWVRMAAAVLFLLFGAAIFFGFGE